MARLPRLVVPGLAHLVIHRGHNDGAALLDDADRDAYVKALRTAATDASVKVHGYGLHPTQVRLLVTPTDERGLALMMQSIGRRYVRWFNARHGRRSSPWEGRFRSTVVAPGPDVLTCLLVVETLPDLGPSLASSGEIPTWTSLSHHLGLRRDPVISEHPAYWQLGNTPFEREAAYRVLAERGVSAADAARVLDAAAGGWALAPDPFAAELAKRTGRRLRPLPRGRPPRPRAD